MHDEKLTSRRVRIHSASHRQNPDVMLQIILNSVGAEFTFDRISRAAHSGSLGTAALDHKSTDHSVENKSIIKSAFNQTNKIIHSIRRNIRIQFRFDHASIFHSDRNNRITHIKNLLLNIFLYYNL